VAAPPSGGGAAVDGSGNPPPRAAHARKATRESRRAPVLCAVRALSARPCRRRVRQRGRASNLDRLVWIHICHFLYTARFFTVHGVGVSILIIRPSRLSEHLRTHAVKSIFTFMSVDLYLMY
jgi:hypothetical protein